MRWGVEQTEVMAAQSGCHLQITDQVPSTIPELNSHSFTTIYQLQLKEGKWSIDLHSCYECLFKASS
jgi:hypothetical protein